MRKIKVYVKVAYLFRPEYNTPIHNVKSIEKKALKFHSKQELQKEIKSVTEDYELAAKI